MFDKEVLLKLLKEVHSYNLKQIFQKMLNQYDLDEPLVAFMKNNGEYECESVNNLKYHFVYDYLTHKIHLQIIEPDHSFLFKCSFKTSEELEEIIENEPKCMDEKIRVCSICGKPITEGYTNEDGDFYFCSDSEFVDFMNETYGEGRWRPEETGYEGWCYEVFDEEDGWCPQSSYYTDFC